MLGTTSARRLIGTATAVAASLATLLGAAPQAAAANYDRCPAGKLCVFQYKDFQGKMEIVSTSRPTLGIWNNSISSVVNNSDLYVLLATGDNYTGEYLFISPHSGPNDFYGGSFGKVWDNSVSSIRVATTDYEVGRGVPWMDWNRQYDYGKRPEGCPPSRSSVTSTTTAAPTCWSARTTAGCGSCPARRTPRGCPRASWWAAAGTR